jgi:peptide deformylase
MAQYHLRKWRDPLLRKPCDPVEDFSKLDELIASMYGVMRVHSGMGLAAPQVGDSRQVVIALIDDRCKVFVNPKIESKEGYIPRLERCLSFPGLVVPTIRNYRINITYQNQQGKVLNGTFVDKTATILQHEVDHLKGRLMFDYFR